MSDLSCYAFTGRLTKDAVFKTLNTTGKSVMNFDVAVNTGWGNNKKVTYIKVAYWGAAGSTLVNYFTKSKTVAISGELSTNTWTAKDGTLHTDICVDAKSVQLVGYNGGINNQSGTDSEESIENDEPPAF